MSRSSTAEKGTEARGVREYDFRSLSTFADRDPRGYIRSYTDAARALLALQAKTANIDGICSVVVYIYRHSIELKLKHLIIRVAKLLKKPVTANHIRTIERFSIQQLWTNLAAMLEQLESGDTSEELDNWQRVEKRLQHLGSYDADFCALRSITGCVPRSIKGGSAIEESVMACNHSLEWVAMLEGLSEDLVYMENWIDAHSGSDGASLTPSHGDKT